METRYIGIRHRVKRTAMGEARPTQVAILSGDEQKIIVLKDDDAELEFVKLGLVSGDMVAMILGGSGDRLAFALSRQAEAVGARVLRLPPHCLKEKRNGGDKDQDALLLATLLHDDQRLFYEMGPAERKLIILSEALSAREDAMKARIACEQRLRQRLIGKIFCSSDGLYPEGSLEDRYDAERASDKILSALVSEESARARDVAKALEEIPVYTEVLSKMEGLGPMISAKLIVAIGNIKKFANSAKLKAFCGAHVLTDGTFPRKRRGVRCNWNPTARQALYLLGDQFVKRPGTPWGKRLNEYKRILREKHPEETVNGKKRYTKGHIHKMAIWRTLTKFTEWFYREWTRLEAGHEPKLELTLTMGGMSI